MFTISGGIPRAISRDTLENMKNIRSTVLVTGFISCLLFAQQAHAFSGTVEFGGSASVSGASGPSTTITVTFKNPWHVLGAPNAPDGVYTGSAGTAATFHTFKFTGDGTTATLVAPVVPAWSFIFGGHTYTFDLDVLSNGHTQSGSMSFSGTGFAFIDGSQATSASWSLQGSSAKGFSFRLSSSTTAAPDAGSAAALLGIALSGIEGVRRILRTRNA
jgi:hypothetical protein